MSGPEDQDDGVSAEAISTAAACAMQDAGDTLPCGQDAIIAPKDAVDTKRETADDKYDDFDQAMLKDEKRPTEAELSSSVQENMVLYPAGDDGPQLVAMSGVEEADVATGGDCGAEAPSYSEHKDAAEPEDRLTLLILPPEILLHICGFLFADEVLQGLADTCRALHHLLTSQAWWKARFNRQWPKHYPPTGDRESVDWAEVCGKRERDEDLWRHSQTKMEHFNLSDGIFAPVDSVHLKHEGRLLFSGSRDRYINVWDLAKASASSPDSLKTCKVKSMINAHKGWVWCMGSVGNSLASGGWDTHVTLWDTDHDCERQADFKLKSAVLCLSYTRDTIRAGTYDKWITNIDTRSGDKRTVKFHKKPVLCLAEQDTCVVSGSEDGCLVMHDTRTGAELHRLQLEAYPVCTSWGGSTLWAGDKTGQLHLIDTTAGLELVESYAIHDKRVNDVKHAGGVTVTAGGDGCLYVLEPSRDPGKVVSLQPESGEVAKVCLQNRVLVSAGAGLGMVGVWRPRSDQDSTTVDETA